MTKFFTIVFIALSAPHALALSICVGPIKGNQVTMTIAGPDSVQFTGLGDVVEFKGLIGSELNSTEIMTTWKSDDNGGIVLEITKIRGLAATASGFAAKLGNFNLTCNF